MKTKQGTLGGYSHVDCPVQKCQWVVGRALLPGVR